MRDVADRLIVAVLIDTTMRSQYKDCLRSSSELRQAVNQTRDPMCESAIENTRVWILRLSRSIHRAETSSIQNCGIHQLVV